LIGREALELFELFKKRKVWQEFDHQQFGEFFVHRYLYYTKDDSDIISIDIKSKIYTKNKLSGDEEFKNGAKLTNELTGNKLTFKSVLWNSVENQQIEEAKKIILQKHPKLANRVLNIKPTKYLYRDNWHGYLYFPEFLLKDIEATDKTIGQNRLIRNYQTIDPQNRRTILAREWKNKIAPILKEFGIKITPFKEVENLQTTQFLVKNNISIVKKQHYDITNSLQKHGLFQQSEQYQIILFDTTDQLNTAIFDKFIQFVNNKFKGIKFKIAEFVNSKNINLNVNKFELSSNIDDFIEYLFKTYQEKHFIPLVVHNSKDQANYNSFYKIIKTAMIQKGVPTQFVDLESIKTKWNDSLFLNLFLGIVAKYGDIPYLLNKKIDQENRINYYIGFDVSRKKIENKVTNISGGAYFFSEQGKFLATKKHQLLGEKIRDDEVSKIFSSKKFKNKRIVIHRDGSKQPEELKTFTQYFTANNIKAHVVYITKNHTGRIFKPDNKEYSNPEKGIFLKYAKNRALIVTSDSKIGTKQPLKIEYFAINDNEMPLQKIAQDIIDLTYMYYGSVQDISLPVTTYYSHKISKFMSDGIEPHEEIFKNPYFL
jgi:hypothetical protein